MIWKSKQVQLHYFFIMKTLLLNHPFPDDDQNKSGRSLVRMYAPPLGPAYIGGMLKAHGFDVLNVDATQFSWEEIRELLRKEAPDIVGISAMTIGRKYAFETVKVVKECLPEAKVIMGGVHSSYRYEAILKLYPVDVVVLGEGEVTTLELVKAWDKKQDLASVKGIAYKDKEGKVLVTPPRDFVKNIDELPFPNYEGYNWDIYPDASIGILNTEENKQYSHLPYSLMLTSRGCPLGCQFCSSTKFWGKKFRLRTPENVLDELEILYKEFGRRFINFADDSFSVNEQRVIEICKGIVKRKLDIKFKCSTRVDFVSDEMAMWLKKAGCLSVSLGVESGSQKILNTIHKRINIDDIVTTFKLLSSKGLNPGALIMVGNPGESDETIQDTINLLNRLGAYNCSASIAMVFPGTDLFALSKEKGLLEDDYFEKYDDVPLYTAEQSMATLMKWQDKIIKNNHKFQNRSLKEKIEDYIRLQRNLFAARSGLFISKRGISRFRSIQ